MKQSKSTSKLSAAVFSAISLLAFGCASSDKGVNTAEIIKYNDFNPAQVLLDNNGRHVNAHGAGFLYDNGKYYMFGEHKVGGTVGNRALVGVHCYSSEDLYNWKDEGIALPMSDDPDSEIIRGTVLERPKVIYNPKTKKYVMWMHLEFRKGKFAKSPKLEHILSESPDYRTARVGVAVADKVAGPYKFIRSFRPQAGVYPINDAEKLKAFRRELDAKNPNWRDCDLNKNRPSDEAVARGQFFLRDFEGGQMARDMTLFVDDDGKAYYACASEENATLQIHELSDDFQGFTGRYVRVLRGDYHEAPAFFKKDGKYWLFTSHCTGWAPCCQSRENIGLRLNAGRMEGNRQSLPWGRAEKVAHPPLFRQARHNFSVAEHRSYTCARQERRLYLCRRQMDIRGRHRRQIRIPAC